MGHDYTVAGSSSSSNAQCQLYITAEGSTLKIRMGVRRTSGNYYSWWYNHSITITVNGTSVTNKVHLNAASASSQYTTSYYTINTWYYMSTATGANSRITDPNSSYAAVWTFNNVVDAKSISMSFNSGTGGFGTLTVSNSTATRTEHTISFAANGGASTPSSITNLYNASITLPSAISHSSESISRTVTLSYGGNGNTGGSTAASTGTQSGTRTYTFASWSGYGAGASYTIGTSNATLTAQWTTSDSYNATTVTTRANGFTRTGYHFKNWNSNTSGTGTAYTAGSGAVSFPASTTAITVYAIWNQDTTAPTGTNFTYDKQAHTGVPTGTGYTLSGTASATNAGSYSATATLSAGRCWTDGTTAAKTISWSIAKRTVTLNWGTVSWTYDGSAHSTTCTPGNVVSGDSCTVTLTGNSVGAGVGTATVTASSLSNSNYQLPSSKTATLTISQREVTLTWGTRSWTYDGSTHSTTCTAGNLVSGTSCTVTLTGNSVGANVGTATVTASSLSNSNYKLPSSKTATLTITARTVTLTWGTTSWVYDGSTHSTTCTAGNLVSGTTCTVTLSNNSVGAGVGSQTVTASALSNSNYALPSSKTTTISITQRQVTLTWGTPTSWVYDKATHSTTCTAGNLVSGTSCTVTLTNNSVGPNVGSVTVTASSLSNGNYKLPSSGLTSVLSITQRTATLSWGTTTWNYDGNAHSTTCTVSNLYSGDTCTVTLSGNSITNPGQTTVTATSLSNTNYVLPSTKTAVLQINPKITFTSDRGSAPSPIWVTYNSQIGNQLPTMPHIIPYKFTGWDANGTRLSTSTIVTQNLTAVAVWILGLTLYLYKNNVWDGPWPLYRWTGDNWELVTPYVWTGSQWTAN